MKRRLTLIAAVTLFAPLLGAAPPVPATQPLNTAAWMGRVLIGELNCVACHQSSEAQRKWITPKAAPRLAEIGNRASPEWITHYLAAPHAVMPGTTMPDLLADLSAADKTTVAESLTHFLLSQRLVTFKRINPDKAAVARGESLYHRVGCVACHQPQKAGTASMPDVPLPDMSSKWSFEGLRKFLLDPLATRPGGRMPSLKLTDTEAADIAHYLLRATRVPAAVQLTFFRGRFHSLEEIDSAEMTRTLTVDAIRLDANQRDRGTAVRFSSWLRIDQPGDYTLHFTAVGAARLSIDGEWIAGDKSWEEERVKASISRTLPAGPHALQVDYIPRGRNPAAMNLEWGGPGIARQPIPSSRLTIDRESAPPVPEFKLDPVKVTAGRAVYNRLQCAACHESGPGNTATPKGPALSQLKGSAGCLDAAPPAGTPDFHLTGSQRESLAAAISFLKRPELAAPSSVERLAHTMATFNCVACHGRGGPSGITAARDPFFTSSGEDLGDEGRLPPALEGVGNKLRPQWIDQVLTEGGSVRPYLDTRMPQFGKENIGHVTALLVELDRKLQGIAASQDAPETLRDAGRKLVGTDGLSCIACHRFNRQPAQSLQVIDLTTANERLNEDWFNQFLLDPNRFHPGTRMPAFWPEGVSSIPTLLDGSAPRQFKAIWTYLADGPRAKFPQGLSRENVELVVGGEAVVYRGKLWEAGFRAVAVGYPGQVNIAFDAEEMRLSLLWRGRFLNAAPHWQVQGMGQIRPLGTDVIILPHGSPLAILPDTNAPWPAEPSKSLGMKFHGYRIDDQNRPTLLYEFNRLNIDEISAPVESAGKPAIRRVIHFGDTPPDNLQMRLAVGKLTPAGKDAWRLNDVITLSIRGGGQSVVRGKGDQQELLVPVRFSDDKRTLEVEYAW